MFTDVHNIFLWIPHNLPCAMAATSDNEELDAMALPARWKERRPSARRYGTGPGSFPGHPWAMGPQGKGLGCTLATVAETEAEGLRLDQYLSKTTKWLAWGWYWTRPKCFLQKCRCFLSAFV